MASKWSRLFVIALAMSAGAVATTFVSGQSGPSPVAKAKLELSEAHFKAVKKANELLFEPSRLGHAVSGRQAHRGAEDVGIKSIQGGGKAGIARPLADTTANGDVGNVRETRTDLGQRLVGVEHRAQQVVAGQQGH